MLDASGLGDSGYMTRMATDFGDYDQCMDVQTPKGKGNEGQSFIGQYCMFRIHFPVPPKEDKLYIDSIDLSGTEMSGTWLEKVTLFYKYFYFDNMAGSVCFPSTCKPTEIEQIFHKREFCLFNSQFDAKFLLLSFCFKVASAESPANVTFFSNCDTKETYNIAFSEFPIYKKLSMWVEKS